MTNAVATPSRPMVAGTLAEFQDLLASRAIKPVFQPIVRLDSGEVVAYEALARGPYGSPFERPDKLFEAARRLRRLNELDWVCRAMAFQTALGVGLNPSLTLFVNTEPVALSSPCPPDLRPLLRQAESRLRIMSELTERRLTADPAALLAAVSRARDNGWGVALDDVGVEPASLALMPFVHPDVIKLDMKIVQERPTAQSVRTVAAVRTKAAKTGASILAEGIETEQHRETAVALGANLGQGWFFGKPAALPRKSTVPQIPVKLIPAPDMDAGPTPFEVISAAVTPTRTTLADVRTRSRGLIDRASADEHLVVLACAQSLDGFQQHLASQCLRLAQQSAFTAVLGQGVPVEPAPNVRGATLESSDPLSREWNVVVIGPQFTGALVSRPVAGMPDTYDVVATIDYDLVVAAARTLLARVAPEVQRGAGPAWQG